MADITDGTSSTMMLGESLYRYDVQGIDHEGNLQGVDHWYFGTWDYLAGINASETLGSTAIEINAVKNASRTIDEKELCFSSHHPAGAQAAFVDGHAKLMSLGIDRAVWSAAGTRDGTSIGHLP